MRRIAIILSHRASILILLVSSIVSASAAGTVVAWGFNGQGQTSVPPGLSNVVTVTAGGMHNLAVKTDGTVVGWGDNYYGQATPPAGLHDAKAVACGWYYSMILRSNGTIVAWGDNGYGQTNVPPDLTNVVAIAAGLQFGLALTAEGRVHGWGYNAEGNASPPAGLSNVIAIAAGIAHGVALRNDGTVAAWGYNHYGQTSVPYFVTNVIAIGAGQEQSLAVLANGTVVCWGINYFGESTPPPGLSNVIAVASGLSSHSLALKSDGTVVGWGLNTAGQAAPPAGLHNVTAIFAGGGHSLALVSAPPAVTNHPPVAQCHDVVISAGENCAATASVDSGSFDPDGDSIKISQSPPGPYPLGTNVVELTVTDDKGASNSCQAVAIVLDKDPPVLFDAAPDVGVLWPPNHQMVEVKISAEALDECGAAAWRIVSVQCNEAVVGPGGRSEPDWVISGEHTVLLRAERSGIGNGRIYKILLQAHDNAGNVSEIQTVTVTVPKSAAGRR